MSDLQSVPEPAPIQPQQVEQGDPVQNNIAMIEMFLKKAGCSDKEYFDVLGEGSTDKLRLLIPDHEDYLDACSDFLRTLNPNIDQIDIVEVQKNVNPFIYLSFRLKLLRNEGADVLTVFHGTDYSSALKICEENFDWRRAGNAVGHIFGRGVSFAKRSTYACHYPRNASLTHRTVVVADILKGLAVHGDRNTVVPPEPFDTTCKPNGDVLVKYDDGEYFPRYVIKYNRTRALPRTLPRRRGFFGL